MKRVAVTLVVAVSAALAFRPVVVRGTAELDTRAIDEIFSHWNSRASPGCAAAIYRDGAIAYAHGYGMASLEHDAPITPKSVFYVGSVSKQFTAFAIYLLAKEGRLSLDDNIRKYLPELHDFGKPITIKNLLHHTSGLRDQWMLLTLSSWRPDDVDRKSVV